jgi:hypothetical protein
MSVVLGCLSTTCLHRQCHAAAAAADGAGPVARAAALRQSGNTAFVAGAVFASADMAKGARAIWLLRREPLPHLVLQWAHARLQL